MPFETCAVLVRPEHACPHIPHRRSPERRYFRPFLRSSPERLLFLVKPCLCPLSEARLDYRRDRTLDNLLPASTLNAGSVDAGIRRLVDDTPDGGGSP